MLNATGPAPNSIHDARFDDHTPEVKSYARLSLLTAGLVAEKLASLQ